MGQEASDHDKEQLRIVIGVALAMTRRKVRRDFAERATWHSDPAQRALSESIAEAVLTHFELSARPSVAVGPSAHTRFTGPAKSETE